MFSTFVYRCLPKDSIYLPPGVHSITDTGDFKDVAIFGLNLVDTIIQVDGNNFVDTFGLSVSGGTFENLSISATNAAENGILLSGDTTFFNKVHVTGFKVGLKVLPGAALVARRCEIFGKFVGAPFDENSSLAVELFSMFKGKFFLILGSCNDKVSAVKLF